MTTTSMPTTTRPTPTHDDISGTHSVARNDPETSATAPSIDDLRDTVQRACENLERARASVIATTKLNVEHISLLRELRNSWIESAQATKALSVALDSCLQKRPVPTE